VPHAIVPLGPRRNGPNIKASSGSKNNIKLSTIVKAAIVLFLLIPH